jgi:hypothetical protein
MSDAAAMLRELSYPWGPGERIKSVIDRTSRMCRLSYWRTSDIWYRKARRVEPHEIEQIAEALRIKNEKAARNELHDLKLRLSKLETLLSTGDADFYRPDADFYREHVRSLGDLRGPVAGVKRR